MGEERFDELFKRKFGKRKILFCAVFVDFIYVYYSAELDGFYNSGSLRDFLDRKATFALLKGQ